MRKSICLAATAALLLGLGASCQKNAPSDDDNVLTIECTTSEASEITTDSATLNGTVSFSNAQAEQADVWFLLGQDEKSLPAEGKKIPVGTVPTGASVSASAYDLEPQTTYHYIICASIDGQEASGKVKSFTTLPQAKAAIVTAEAENVTQTKAVLSGYIEGVPAENAMFGVMYSSDEDFAHVTYYNATELDENNKFTITATDLFAHTQYYYKAYLMQDDFITGEVKTFTTLDYGVTVTTEDATDVDYFNATLHGTLSVDSEDPLGTFVWFLYSDEGSTLEELRSSCPEIHLELAEDGSFTLPLTSLSYNTTYYYVACSNVHYMDFYGEIKSFKTTGDVPAGAVDMGLPVYWATTNVGADEPEEYGQYFAWGETEEKEVYDWSTYKLCNGTSSSFTKYSTNSKYGTVDNKTELDPEDDVAHVRMGGYWRMPTQSEWQNLYDGCTWTWTQENGVNGYIVTSKKTGESIFLPAGGYKGEDKYVYDGIRGYYWTSTLDWSLSDFANHWYIRSDKYTWYTEYRYYGYNVRPVFGLK